MDKPASYALGIDDHPDVSVVVVNYNTAHLLAPMFGALEASHGSLKLQVIVIDNANNDLRVIDVRTDTEVDRVPLVASPPTNPKRSRLAKLMFSPDGRHLVATSYASALATYNPKKQVLRY